MSTKTGEVHLRVAADPELETALLRVFTEELEEVLRATSKAGEHGRGGSVTFLQHFGSSLNLHVHFHTLAIDERIAVERFCRDALRGPIANHRLTRGPRALLTYRLKAPKPDGTTELVLSPIALLERLSHLIPQRGRHMTRYHGCRASAAEWRSRIVPNPRPKLDLPLQRAGGRSIDWASLLRRVFLLEVLACACGGTRRVISTIEEGATARKILDHLGLPATVPAPAPARVDRWELFPTGPPANRACEPPPVETCDQPLPPHFDVA